MSRATRSTKPGAVAAPALVLAACVASMANVREFEAQRNTAELIRVITNVDSPDDVKSAADHALRRIGEAAVEPLVQRLGDSDFFVRAMVASVLGDIGDRRASRPLLAALAKESNGSTAVVLGLSIEKIGDASAIAVLREMSGMAARSALGTIVESQRCRAEAACKSEGKCTAVGDTPGARCEPRSDADCRWSEACAKDKRCHLHVAGGRCVADICEGSSGVYRGCR